MLEPEFVHRFDDGTFEPEIGEGFIGVEGLV